MLLFSGIGHVPTRVLLSARFAKAFGGCGERSSLVLVKVKAGSLMSSGIGLGLKSVTFGARGKAPPLDAEKCEREDEAGGCGG
jgi:hypothetical protein